MLVVNAGAADVSIDGDPRASYAIIGLERAIPPSCASIVRLAYDRSNVADDVERRRVPFVPPDMFRREA